MSVIPALFYLLVLTQAERVLEKETTSREVQLRDIVARRGGRHVTKEDVDNLARMAHISKATEENQMDDFWGDPEEENRLPKGTTVWGGDMVIRPTDLMKETQINGSSLMEVGAGGRGFETRPHGQVYYRFQGNPPNHLKEKFRAACDEWSRRVGCLQFIEIQHHSLLLMLPSLTEKAVAVAGVMWVTEVLMPSTWGLGAMIMASFCMRLAMQLAVHMSTPAGTAMSGLKLNGT